MSETSGLPAGSRCRSRRLENGLNVLAVEVPTARQLRLVGAVGIGYLDEPDTCRGLAHLLEHALFLGSSGWPEAGGFGHWVGEQGGRYNARTDEHATHVHLHLPPACAEAGLARLMDLLIHPRLDPALTRHEVAVIDAEFRARLADPALHRLMALGRLSPSTHSARACHAGHRRSLGDDADTLASRLASFHRRHYRAEAMSLVMLGPLPLAEQLALLEAYGRRIPGGACLPERTPRWDDDGRARAWVSWCPPEASDTAVSPGLELLWTLPGALAVRHVDLLSGLLDRLTDGDLAATLQRHGAIDELDATLTFQGPEALLSLSLGLTAEGYRQRFSVFATCQATWQAALQELPERAPAPPRPVDLDAWPREQAIRLAQQTPDSQKARETRFTARHALAEWLPPQRCRVLERSATLEGDDVHAAEETDTLLRLTPLPSTAALPPFPPAPAPRLSPRHRTDHPMPAGTERLTREDDLTVWHEGLDLAPYTAGPVGYCCLGWTVPSAGQTARLERWRQATLALRQAARAQGMTLQLGSDAQGDWLIALGKPDGVPALVEQALARWPVRPSVMADAPEKGLIAQRLLARLERSDASGSSRHSAPSRRCWIGGLDDAGAFIERLGTRLPTAEISSEVRPHDDAGPGAENMHWLAPQGDDHALMLEVAGQDDSPTSRWLMQLLGHCHDAAFYHEMRQRRGLGYVAAVRYREAAGWPRLGYVVQSPHADIATLREAIVTFMQAQAVMLARLAPEKFERQRCGLLARQGPPETGAEALERAWQALRRAGGESPHAPWQDEHRALMALTAADLSTQAQALVDGTLPQRWWAHAPLRKARLR